MQAVTYLEDIGEIPEIKDVMKLDGSWKESRCHFLMQVQCCSDNFVHVLDNLTSESTLSDVLR